MKYVSIDMESTGLNADTDDIIEFGAVLDDLSVLAPIEELPTFHCYFRKDSYTGHPYALSMHPEIFRRIAENDRDKYNFFNAMKFGNAFKKFLVNNGYEEEGDRVTINVAGKNFGACDLQFLNKQTDLSKHVGIKSRILDPAILFLERGDTSLPGLATCKARMGLEESVDHTAVADALDVIHLLRYAFGNKFVKSNRHERETHQNLDGATFTHYCAKCGAKEEEWTEECQG